jgi:hypothetical protein
MVNIRFASAQQAVVEVEELLFRGHPEVVDAEFAVGLRDEHSSDGIRSVSLLPERKSNGPNAPKIEDP